MTVFSGLERMGTSGSWLQQVHAARVPRFIMTEGLHLGVMTQNVMSDVIVIVTLKYGTMYLLSLTAKKTEALHPFPKKI
jgi:hypothetical protein